MRALARWRRIGSAETNFSRQEWQELRQRLSNVQQRAIEEPQQEYLRWMRGGVGIRYGR